MWYLVEGRQQDVETGLLLNTINCALGTNHSCYFLNQIEWYLQESALFPTKTTQMYIILVNWLISLKYLRLQPLLHNV